MSIEQANARYCEQFHPEPLVIQAARDRAAQLGCLPVSAAVGSTLRYIASATQAENVIEVGTGSGVSGLYLLEGMRRTGMLTSIDLDAERQHAAAEAFVDAGAARSRFRLINGDGLDVLSRLRDAAYDLVLLDGQKTDPQEYFDHAVRVLRTGGTLAMDNALWKGRVADPARRDPQTSAVRELGRLVRERTDLISTMLNIGDGLLLATKRAP